MFLRRRGCVFGCGSFLLLCVALSLAGWFVGVPRLTDALEESLGDSISTAIADDLSGSYAPAELRAGARVQIPFASINNRLMEPGTTTDNVEQIERFEITSRGDRIVLAAWFNGQSYEVEAVPEITPDGRLHLEPVDDGGWLQGKVLEILAGGTEHAVNAWLETNGLVLTGIELDADGMELVVEGE